MDGDFTCTQLPLQLSSLELEFSDLIMQETCECVSSLQKLCIADATLRTLVPDRFAACPALKELQLESCDIRPLEGENWFDLDKDSLTIFPVLAGLSELKSLTLGHASNSPAEVPDFDLSCLCSLTSLEFLQVSVECSSVRLSAGLTALQSLSYLLIASKGGNDELDLKLELDWQQMKALQCLEIGDLLLSCDADILGLSSLQNLESLNLQRCQPYDTSALKHVSTLICCLAKHRPDIRAVFDGCQWGVH